MNLARTASLTDDIPTMKSRIHRNSTRLVAAAAILAAALLASCGPESRRQRAMSRGERYLQEGRLEYAELEFKWVVRDNPQYGEAYFKLGSVQRRLNRPVAAYESLTRAVSLLPSGHAAHLALADLCLSMYMANPARPKEWSDQVAATADSLLRQDPNSFDGLRLKGMLAMTDDRPQEAIQLLERANRVRPGQPELVSILVQTLILAGRGEEAERMALNLIESSPQFAPVYDILYFHYLHANRTAEAEGVLKTKIAKNPNEGLFVVQLCRHYRRTRQLAELEQALASLAANSKQYSNARLLAGDFFAETGQMDRAMEQYELGARQDPKSKIAYQKRQAAVLASQNQTDRAVAILDEILKSQPRDDDARASRAALWIATGTPELLDAAVKEFRQLTQAHPDSLEYLHNLARALRLKGAEGEARSILVSVLERQPDHVPALESLAEISLRSNQYTEALGYAERVLELRPRNPNARLIRATCQAGLGHYAKSRETLAAILKDEPNLMEAHLQLGLLNLVEKRFGEAEAIFRRFYRPGAGDVRMVRHMVELHAARKDWASALRTIQAEIDAHPSLRPLRELLASTAARSGDHPLAIRHYRKLLEENPNDAGLALQLGALCIDVKDPANAVAYLEKAVKAMPDNPGAVGRLGSAYQLAGRVQEAENQFRRSLQLDPKNAIVMNNLAYLLAESERDLDEALNLAQAAVEAMPDNPVVRDTLGLVFLKRGMTDKALRIFEELSSTQRNSSTIRYHHGLALLKRGNKRKAKAELAAALNTAPSERDRKRIEQALQECNQ